VDMFKHIYPSNQQYLYIQIGIKMVLSSGKQVMNQSIQTILQVMKLVRRLNLIVISGISSEIRISKNLRSFLVNAVIPCIDHAMFGQLKSRQ
ncbi:hypothetical protein pb186bvf_019642, partial [Paramecium bursaria]